VARRRPEASSPTDHRHRLRDPSRLREERARGPELRGAGPIRPDILTAMPIKIVLAEDNYLVREGVARLLETEKELDLLAAVEDLPTLMKAVEELSPQVVVTDIRMPPTSTDEGIQASEQLRESHPEVGVVVLSQYAEP